MGFRIASCAPGSDSRPLRPRPAPSHGRLQQRGRRRRRGAAALQGAVFQARVGAALALQLALPRRDNPGLDLRAGFALAPGAEQFGRRGRLDQHLDIDAIEQRAGHPALVAAHLVLAAAAGLAGVAVMPAGTRVHGRDQLEPGRELGLARGPGDHDATGLQRLAQHFEYPPVEFGQLVQEQHAVVSQRYFARGGSAATADQGRRRSRVMRRQQSGQASGQHRLAGARRTDQQQVVLSRGRNLQGAFRDFLSAHVGQVRTGRGGAGGQPPRAVGGQWLIAAQVCGQFEQVGGGVDFAAASQRGLRGVVGGHRQGPPSTDRGQGRRQHPANRAQFAAQAQLGVEFHALGGLDRELARGGQNTQRDRQVEAAALLGQVRRCQVDRDPPGREFETGIDQCGADPVLALLDRGFRQSNDRQAGQPASQVDFDTDG